MATNVTTQFTDQTGSDAWQSIANTLLLIRGTYALVHQIMVKQYPLSAHSGNNMIWRRYEALGLATTPIPEGGSGTSFTKTRTDVSAKIQRYGAYIEDSDLVLDTMPEAHALENVELLSQQMGETMDQLYRDIMDSFTNTVFVNGSSVATVTRVIDQNALERACRLLRVNKARPFSPAIMPGQNVGTSGIQPSYWAVCDERVAFDIRHTNDFVLTCNYGSNKGGVLLGEFGADKNGFRYLATPNGFFTPGASGVTAAGTDVKNTGGFVDVYSVFFIGQEAIGGVNLAKSNGGVIRSGDQASVANPLKTRQTIGWKKYDARAILNQNFGVELRTCVSL